MDRGKKWHTSTKKQIRTYLIVAFKYKSHYEKRVMIFGGEIIVITAHLL